MNRELFAVRPKWIGHRFDFAADPAEAVEYIERLWGAVPRVAALVDGVDPASLTRRTGSAWSIQQDVGHLIDLEPLWSGRVEQILDGVAELAPADMTNRATDEAPHDATPIEELLAGFRAVRSEFCNRLWELPAEAFARSSWHGRLARPMRLIDLCSFVCHHDDFHLARIRAQLG